MAITVRIKTWTCLLAAYMMYSLVRFQQWTRKAAVNQVTMKFVLRSVIDRRTNPSTLMSQRLQASSAEKGFTANFANWRYMWHWLEIVINALATTGPSENVLPDNTMVNLNSHVEEKRRGVYWWNFGVSINTKWCSLWSWDWLASSLMFIFNRRFERNLIAAY